MKGSWGLVTGADCGVSAPVAFHIVLHVCESRVFAPVAFRIVPHAALHIVSHGCESWIFAPVVLLIELHVCRSGPSAPVGFLIDLHVCKITPFATVGFHGCCPELRQGPALLRVLRNSPRAMPLFGFPIIVMAALYTSRKQGKLQRACV